MTINCPKCGDEVYINSNNCKVRCVNCDTQIKVTVQIISKYKCPLCLKEFESTEPDIDKIVHYCEKCKSELI